MIEVYLDDAERSQDHDLPSKRPGCLTTLEPNDQRAGRSSRRIF